MNDNQPAEGISTTRPQEQPCPETVITNGTSRVPSVSTATQKGTREGQPTKRIKDLYLRYRSLTHSLTSLSQNNNQQPTTETATATGTAAVWLYLVAAVLSPFVEVSR